MVCCFFVRSRVGDVHKVTGSLEQRGDHSIMQNHAQPRVQLIRGLSLSKKKYLHTIFKKKSKTADRRVKAEQPDSATHLTSATALGRTFRTILDLHCRKNVTMARVWVWVKNQIKFCQSKRFNHFFFRSPIVYWFCFNFRVDWDTTLHKLQYKLEKLRCFKTFDLQYSFYCTNSSINLLILLSITKRIGVFPKMLNYLL